MTMRNAVPRFGMRAAVVLAVVALAALLAVGSPASAQSSDVDEIFSATMTVGGHPSFDIKGYYNVDPNTYGSLSNTEFTSPRTGLVNAIHIIIDRSVGGVDKLHIGLVNPPGDPELEAMTLHIGGRTFKFVDALHDSTGQYHTYAWPITPRFGWADTDTVAVSITALPIVVVEPPRGRTGVQYGGNDNAAEATAEFIFTRTGSTDEALSFTFLHHQSGETATRTFKAGEASFSNFHWAIDVDASNNPVCIITWQVQPGDGYVPGYGFTGVGAFVTVIGPGTTCMGGI